MLIEHYNDWSSLYSEGRAGESRLPEQFVLVSFGFEDYHVVLSTPAFCRQDGKIWLPTVNIDLGADDERAFIGFVFSNNLDVDVVLKAWWHGVANDLQR